MEAKKKAPRSEEQIDQEFLDAIKKVYDEYNRVLVAVPAFRFSQERRAYDTVANIQVARLEEQ